MSSQIPGPTPLDNSQQLLGKIEDLKLKLQSNMPGYESLLFIIHKQLASDESLVHLLSDEQVGIIVAGLKKRKGIILAEVKKKKDKSSLKNIDVEDL